MNKKTSSFSPRSYAWTILVVFLFAGWFYPVIGLMAIVCMVAPVVVAAFSGKRKWCALFCPRGIFNDVILAKITRNVKPPAFLRSTAFKVAFLGFLIFNLVVGLARAASVAEAGLVFVRMVSLTTAIAIILGFYYQQRAWCGFCPMGFLASLTIRVKQIFGRRREATRKHQPLPGKLILYTGSHCPPCREIKEFLSEKGVDFAEQNIDDDKKARDEMYTVHKSTTVPTLVVGGKVYKSPLREEIDKLLDEQDYANLEKAS